MAGKRTTASAAEAFDRVVDFLELFEKLDDLRPRGKVLCPLDEVAAGAAVISGVRVLLMITSRQHKRMARAAEAWACIVEASRDLSP
jgi:hypothetical protein